jgi:putative phage-type endonuclease
VTPVIYRDFEQHSPEWFQARAGHFTASHAGTIMGGLETSGLQSLIKDLAWERVYGPEESTYQSAAMQRGNELEAEARDWYAFTHDIVVEQVGFVSHGSLPHVGWSPDGIALPHAIEVKCPLHKAWMEVKRTQKIPAEYRWQCRWAMWVGQLATLDFVAYHPKAGGLVIPCELTNDERDQMGARIAVLEPKVQDWVSILTEKEQAA